ncbi:MAG: hypothetical protein AAF797_02975 [Planctomycetota bacterium]
MIASCTPVVASADSQTLPATTHPHADPNGWQPIPLISAENREAGEAYGGEGGQWIQSLAIDSTDGSFALYGLDVSGMLRSIDGGQTWEPSNVGYTPRGAGGAAIDPNFSDRAIMIGVNSLPSGRHGVYLTEDRAGSWRHVLPIEMSGVRDIRDQVAFDRATADHEAGLTRDVYWSRPTKENPIWGKVDPDPSIYRSADGGRTWSRLPGSAPYAGGILRDDPHQAGRLMTTAAGGIYITEDRAASWERRKDGTFTGLDVSLARPGDVWLTDAKTVYRSTDGGLSFSRVEGAASLALEGYTLRGIEVSPADPDRLILWRQQDKGWNWTYHVSHDAGRTWYQSRHINDKAFLPRNQRQGVFAWHPTDPNVILSTGGDWPTRSTDGGLTFPWSGRGFYGLLIGGRFQFNPNYPDLVLIVSQDYNGAVTEDGGRTWRYLNIADKSWGGFCYGGYAVTPRLMLSSDSTSWGGNRVLTISRDGGNSWKSNDEVVFTRSRNVLDGKGKPGSPPFGYEASYASPTNPRVWFFGPYRSTDAGRTWSLMRGCQGVTGSAVDDKGTLIGMHYDPERKVGSLVVSTDHGETWEAITQIDKPMGNIDYHKGTNTAYFTAGNDLYRDRLDDDQGPVILKTPRDQFGNKRVRSVAIDPIDPLIIYMAQNKDIYTVNASAARSFDGGDTWEVLTRNTPLDGKGLDGGRESFGVRVHPVTREPWFQTGCYGNWRYAAPSQ